MTDQQIISTVNGLDTISKSYLYLTMCNRYITVDHDFEINIDDSRKELIQKCKRNRKIPTFNEFFSEQNIIQHNVGGNWKENGYASPSWTTLLGAYNEYKIQFLCCSGSHFDPKGLEKQRRIKLIGM